MENSYPGEQTFQQAGDVLPISYEIQKIGSYKRSYDCFENERKLFNMKGGYGLGKLDLGWKTTLFFIIGLLVSLALFFLVIPLVCCGIFILATIMNNLVFKIHDAIEQPAGEITGNFSKRKIIDSSGNIVATLKYGRTGFEGEIETPHGSFTVNIASGSYIIKDSNENTCFVINMSIESMMSGKFSVSSSGIMTPFLTCAVAVCIIERQKVMPGLGSVMLQTMSKYGIEQESESSKSRNSQSFNIQKSGTIGKVYRISKISLAQGHRDFIIARRSALNRLGVYLFLVIIIIGFFLLFVGYYGFGSLEFRFLGLFPFLLGLVVLSNIFVGIRRIAVTAADGSLMGTIKGNLFFTKWKTPELPDSGSLTISFALLRSRGMIDTPSDSFTVKMHSETGLVYDSHENLCFSVQSLDSIYVRKRFRIESRYSGPFGQLNPFLICFASICIIERMFKPKSESDNG